MEMNQSLDMHLLTTATQDEMFEHIYDCLPAGRVRDNFEEMVDEPTRRAEDAQSEMANLEDKLEGKIQDLEDKLVDDKDVEDRLYDLEAKLEAAHSEFDELLDVFFIDDNIRAAISEHKGAQANIDALCDRLDVTCRVW